MAPLIDSLTSLITRSPSAMTIQSLTNLAKRSNLSPMAIQDIHRREDSSNDKYHPGNGIRAPDAFNKTLFIILFALIFMALVLTAIYFFFFARNGGFHWKENDWEDYKTTVLRRKGPDGKTLSNATKSTKLGGGSIVPKWKESYSDVSSTSSKSRSDLEKGEPKRSSGRVRQHFHDNRDDPVFKDYAHERPAGVGGYNKPDDGSRYAPTNPTTSEVSAPKMTRRERKAQEKEEKKAKKEAKAEAKKDAKAAAAAAKHVAASEESGSGTQQSQSYQSQYRPAKPTMRAVSGSVDAAHDRTATARNRKSNNSNNRASYAVNDDDDQSSGTKSYPCHIPGISKSSSQQQAPKPPAHGTSQRPRYSFEQGDDYDDEADDRVPHMGGGGTAAAAAAAAASMFRGRGEVRPDESVSQIGAAANHYGGRRGYGGGFRRGRGQGAI